MNIHKIRVVRDINEEMLQYQQTTSAQKCFFDPNLPFQRRLFNESYQKENLEKKKAYQNDKTFKKVDDQQAGDVIEYTLKRVMKTINNYILNEWQKLFFSGTTHTKENEAERKIQKEEFFSNQMLLRKAGDELKFCENKNITAAALIKECVAELEALGFLNL